MGAQPRPLSYEELTRRNQAFVPQDLQTRLRTTRVLVAGCGVGSVVSECLARLGVSRFVLVDGDTVAGHNLNRQSFRATDVDRPKVAALAERLREINPGAEVVCHETWVTAESAPRLVAQADLVFDLIDFLDLSGIIALHDEAKRAGKPVLSGMTLGFGAGAIHFPADGSCSARQIFGLPETGSVAGASYVQHFGGVIDRLAPVLEPSVLAATRQALNIMADGKPCPASQLAVGAMTLAGLLTTMMVRLLAGESVPAAPTMVAVSLTAACATAHVDLMGTGGNLG